MNIYKAKHSKVTPDIPMFIAVYAISAAADSDFEIYGIFSKEEDAQDYGNILVRRQLVLPESLHAQMLPMEIIMRTVLNDALAICRHKTLSGVKDSS